MSPLDRPGASTVPIVLSDPTLFRRLMLYRWWMGQRGGIDM